MATQIILNVNSTVEIQNKLIQLSSLGKQAALNEIVGKLSNISYFKPIIAEFCKEQTPQREIIQQTPNIGLSCISFFNETKKDFAKKPFNENDFFVKWINNFNKK